MTSSSLEDLSSYKITCLLTETCSLFERRIQNVLKHIYASTVADPDSLGHWGHSGLTPT